MACVLGLDIGTTSTIGILIRLPDEVVARLKSIQAQVANRSLVYESWGYARRLAEQYDIRGAGIDGTNRLLSGGNMQKLILGRAFDGEPQVILANQPTRGLDVGAVAYVHTKLLEARNRGAAILLISEDLDEVLALADRIVVISKGRLSPPSQRGELSVREIGERMAGHGFAEEASNAA